MSKKNIILLIVLGIGAFFAYSIINTSLLIYSFKKGASDDGFRPEAISIEVGQNDDDSKRIWKIVASAGESNSALTEIEAKGVFATVYDESEEPKIEVKANRASFQHNNARCTLKENVEINVLNNDVIMKAGKLIMKKREPLEISDGVTFISKTNPARQIHANNATIDADITYMILNDIQHSPIGSELFIEGGRARIELFEKQPTSLLLTQGARVYKENMLCKGNQLTIYLRDGQPQTAVFTGNAEAQQDGKILKADSIKYNFVTNEIKAQGHIQTN